MSSNSTERYLTAPWKRFVDWLAVPAEAEMKRLGIKDPNEKNAFAHAYTAALIAHGYLGMPISRGRPADAADLVDVLGRAKENLPGIFGRQTDFRDYYRDLWNNGVGADIGNYAKSHLYSREEIGRLVKDAMDDGAIVSSLTDSRIPAPPGGGYLSWPIPSPPQYQGPYAAPDRQDSFDNRFGRWGSSPAPDRPDSFDNRFGNWGTSPAAGSGNPGSRVLRALEKYRRSEVPDGPASTSAQGAPPATPALQPDMAGKGAVRILGKFVGNNLITPAAAASPSRPPLPGPTAPNPPGQESASGDQSENALGAPSPDPYPRLRRVSSAFPDITPLNPDQPVQPQRSPPLGIFSGKPMSQWLLPPSVWGLPDNSDASGNGDWFTYLAGIAFRNPTQPAPSPQDDGLRDIYGDDPTQPWTLQRLR
jgi:hypothetical protein